MIAFLEMLKYEEFFMPTSCEEDAEYSAHFRNSICKVCKRQFVARDPEYVSDKTICWFCCYDIKFSSIFYYKRLIKTRIVYKNVPEMLNEIKEFGMRPERIFQTILFENYVFSDLIAIK